MQRFFGTASTNWNYLDGQLHVYCIPALDSALTLAMQDTSASLEQINCLALQPPEYYHATVQLLDWNINENSPEQIRLLINNLAQVYSEVPAFSLEFSAPLLRKYAIETVATSSSTWEQLVKRTRLAAQKSGCVLPAAPYGAHLSLAYGIESGSDEIIQKNLANNQKFPVTYHFDSCELVSVTQDRQQGIFSFTSLARFPLQNQSKD